MENWTIISTILGILLLMWGIWQHATNKKEKEIHKSQVKLWQHHAAGIMHGLIVLSQDIFSSVKDSQVAAKAVLPNAHSLYSSLNEERLFSEKEIKEKQLKLEAETKQFQSAVEAMRKQNVPQETSPQDSLDQ